MSQEETIDFWTRNNIWVNEERGNRAILDIKKISNIVWGLRDLVFDDSEVDLPVGTKEMGQEYQWKIPNEV